MSKSANKTTIGAFVLGAVALLFIAVAVLGSGQLFQNSTRYVLFFDSSIKGLSLGAPVMFRGVPMGRVVDIQLTGDLQDMVFRTPVFIELNQKAEKSFVGSAEIISDEQYLNRLIAHGLRASLANQSLLTGQLLVELNFYPTEELPSYIEKTRRYDGVLEIPTIPSKFEDIMQKAFKLPYEQITANILAITEELNKLLKSSDIQQIAYKTNILLEQLNTLSRDMDAAVREVKTLSAKYTRLGSLAEQQVGLTLNEATAFFKAANAVADEAKKTLAEAGAILNKNGPTVLELNQAIRELSDSARAVRTLANTLENKPESLLRGK